MTSDRPPIHPALPGTEATWTKPPLPLEIWLAVDLDEVTRERYIAQAMTEHGQEYRRHRRGLLALPFVGGIDTARDAVRSHKAIATAATVSVLTAGGIALAVVHDDYHTTGHPPGAASAPRQSTPPSSVPPKPVPSPTSPSRTRPSQPPSARPTPATSTSLEPTVTAITSDLQPRLPLPTSLPITLPPPIGGRPTIRPTAVPTATRAPTRVCVLRIHVDGARTVLVGLRVCLRT